MHRQAASLALDPEIALAGESTDANLALAAAAALRDRGEVSVALAALFYGMHARDFDIPSHRAFGGGKFNLTARTRWFRDCYLGHMAECLDPRVTPESRRCCRSCWSQPGSTARSTTRCSSPSQD
jgi:acetyl esterase